MARVTIDDTLLKNMANAIRTKDGSIELFGVDTFENKILNIPSGVELPTIIKTGTFTVANDEIMEIEIKHGCSGTPNVYIVYPDNPDYAIENIPYTILGIAKSSPSTHVTNHLSKFTTQYYSNIGSIVEDDTNITFTITKGNFRFRAGLIYRWIAWG